MDPTIILTPIKTKAVNPGGFSAPMDRIELGIIIILLSRDKIASVQSPFTIQNDKVRTRNRVLV
jgi:hypothetical protein